MKAIDLRVIIPDNGGYCLHIVPKTKGAKGKLYITPETTPLAIGELFLTLQADIRLDAASAGVDLDNIEF
jgi:hypothetical protein